MYERNNGVDAIFSNNSPRCRPLWFCQPKARSQSRSLGADQNYEVQITSVSAQTVD